MKKTTRIALESRLKACGNILTLGVKPNFSDYSDKERELIRNAETIYFPSVFYADLFDAMGKRTFPSYHTYKCVQDKIKQTAMFELIGIPHPRTRTFYGKRVKEKIESTFDYPFIAKIPRGSAMGRGVFLIENENDLFDYLEKSSPAYIQEFLPIKRDIRVVVIGREAVHAYWRIASGTDFRTNVAVGGSICLENIPSEAVALAVETAQSCGWNDVGIDVCRHGDQYYILEANMKYGKEGFRKAGIDYFHLLEDLIERGKI